MSTTRTPDICTNFSGDCGDPVNWQNVPSAGCTISQSGSHPFPFSPATQGSNGYYINLPSPSTVTIKAGLSSGTSYEFIVSCCTQEAAPKTVTIK